MASWEAHPPVQTRPATRAVVATPMTVVVQATAMGTAPGMEMVPETGTAPETETGTAATEMAAMAPVGAVDDIRSAARWANPCLLSPYGQRIMYTAPS